MLCGRAFIAQEWCQMDSPAEQSPRAICRTAMAWAVARYIFLLCLPLPSEDLMRQRILQNLCLLKQNSVRATYWRSGFGDAEGTDASTDLFPGAAWDKSFGSLWFPTGGGNVFEQLLHKASTKQALHTFLTPASAAIINLLEPVLTLPLVICAWGDGPAARSWQYPPLCK